MEIYTEEDYSCHCGCGYNVTSWLLKQALEDLAERLGFAPELNCVCRCPYHNYEVGGVVNSQHVEGTAADISVPEDMTVDELADICAELCFDGIGRYYDGGFVHADVREGRTGAGIEWTDQD